MNKYFLFLTLITFASCRKDHADKNRYDPTKIDASVADGGTFIEPSIAEPSLLNPLLASETASSDINRLVYNSLIRYDKNLRLEGELAESWDVEKNGLVITFHLRKNILWQDGQPFTSADVMFTYQKLIDPKTRTPYGGDYLLVKKAEAPDPYTFRVTYGEPFAPALESWGIGLIAEHIYENGDINNHPANRHPIGTGPYIFKEWVTEEKVILEANPNYYEGKPHIEKYIYRIIPDQSVQFLELRQGTLSIMSPNPDQYNGYAQFFESYNKYRYPSFSYDYLAFNLANNKFKDIRIRQALAYGINKELLIQGVYQGLAVPATGPFPTASWAYNPNVKNIPYDPDKARALMAEAGWSDHDGDGILDKDGKPFEFTITTNHGNDVRKYMAQIIQDNLQKIGIKVDIRIIEWSVFIHKYIDKREFEAVLLGWSLSRDPDCFSIWHSSQIKEPLYNFVSYKNEEVDRLIMEGRRTFGEEKRKPIYQKIHALIAADVPYIFLVVPESRPVVHKKLMGVEKAPAGLLWNFDKWYIPKAWQSNAQLSY